MSIRKAKKSGAKKPARKRLGKPVLERPLRRKNPRKPARTPKPPKKKGARHVTVIMLPVTGPQGLPALRRSKGDKIRWWNLDTVDRTLQFNIWIFREPQAPILVPAGSRSGWYTISSTVPTGTYSYAIMPAFPSQGPPDPPEVVADP